LELGVSQIICPGCELSGWDYSYEPPGHLLLFLKLIGLIVKNHLSMCPKCIIRYDVSKVNYPLETAYEV
jgi:hypothetical protein